MSDPTCAAVVALSLAQGTLSLFTSKLPSAATPAVCGKADGKITIQISGGTAPYSYSLNGKTQSTGTFENLPEGTYQVNVKDSEGQCGSASVKVEKKENQTPPKLIETKPEIMTVAVAQARVVFGGEPLYIAPDGRPFRLPAGATLKFFDFGGSWASPAAGTVQGFEIDGQVYFAEVTYQDFFVGFKNLTACQYYTAGFVDPVPAGDQPAIYLKAFDEDGKCGYKELVFTHRYQPSADERIINLPEPASFTTRENVWTKANCTPANTYVKDYAAGLAPKVDANTCVFLIDKTQAKVYKLVAGSSELSSLTPQQARDVVKNKTFDCKIGIVAEWDGTNWEVDHDFKDGALQPFSGPGYTGTATEVKAISDAAVEKVKQNKGIAASDGEGEFVYQGLDIIEAIIEVKNATLTLCNEAKVPEKYWDESTGPIKAPTLSGVADGAITELKDIPEMVGFGLQLVTEPETAKGIWRGIKSITPDKVKTMLLGAINEKLEKYSKGGNITKHEAGKDGVQIAMVVIAGVKSIAQNGKNIAELAGAVDDLANLADDARKLIDDAIEEGAGKQLVKESKEAITDAITMEKMALDLADEASKKGRKLTWHEVKALFKRGNDFNRKGYLRYPNNEVTIDRMIDGVKKSFRVDSYIDGNSIISRKATDLANIKQSTFEGYLSELTKKYSPGATIRSPGNPSVNGKILSGSLKLEIPSSNKNFPLLEQYKQIAANKTPSIEIVFLDE